MLVYFRCEFHLCGDPCVYACKLSGQDTYFVERGSGFLSTKAHIAFSCFHICKTLGHDPWRVIEVPKLISVKIIKVRSFFHWVFRKGSFRHFNFRQIASICHAEPVIFGPHHFLNGRLSSKCTAKFRYKRSGAEMDQINFSCGKFHIASMTGFLKYRVRIIVLWFQMVWILALVGFSRNAGNDGILRVFFIWAPDIFGTSHRNAVVISGASLCTHDVVILASFCEMRCLDAASVCATSPDPLRITDDLFFLRRIFYHTDSTWLLIAFSCFPLQGYHVFFAIGVMEK